MWVRAGRSRHCVTLLKGPEWVGTRKGCWGLPTVIWGSASSSSSLLGNLRGQQNHPKHLPLAWLLFAHRGAG